MVSASAFTSAGVTGHTVGTGYSVAARGLRRTYITPGGVSIQALDGVDLDLESSSVTALTGPSGSGKSTLLHLLGAMDAPDEGTILVDDELELTALGRSELIRYRRTVGFVFQHFALLPALTARDNVMLPVLPYKTDYDAVAKAESLLADVGLGGRENALPSQLSGGQRQRVAIARALMNDPRLVVADEPTGNLDSATGQEIIDLLFRLRDERGITIIIGTHDRALAQSCDRAVGVLDGRIAE